MVSCCGRVFGGGWPTLCFHTALFPSTPAGSGVPSSPAWLWIQSNWICQSLYAISCHLHPLPLCYHTPHKTLAVLVRAFPEMPSFYLCFQVIIWPAPSGFDCAQQSQKSSSLKLPWSSSEPLKRAGKAGCYNCSLFEMQPSHCSLVLSLCPTFQGGGKQFGWVPSCPPAMCSPKYSSSDWNPADDTMLQRIIKKLHSFPRWDALL